MADSSTTVTGIPFRFSGDSWARRQLHAGIRYVSTPWILMELLSGLNGVPGGGKGGTRQPVYKCAVELEIE